MCSVPTFRLFRFLFEGCLVLVGGDPGVGKSTLLLQVVICCNILSGLTL